MRRCLANIHAYLSQCLGNNDRTEMLIVAIGVIGFWGCMAFYCIADEDRLLGERRRRDAAIDAAIAAAAADDDGDDVEN